MFAMMTSNNIIHDELHHRGIDHHDQRTGDRAKHHANAERRVSLEILKDPPGRFHVLLKLSDVGEVASH